MGQRNTAFWFTCNFIALVQSLPTSLSLIPFLLAVTNLDSFFPVHTSYWQNRPSQNHFSGEYWLWPSELLYDFGHSLSIHIPFSQCAEKISSPRVKPLGVELSKLDYPLMSAYSAMNTDTRTPPVLCHSHYSYTGQNYFDINLVGDKVNWRKRSRLESLLDLKVFKSEVS